MNRRLTAVLASLVLIAASAPSALAAPDDDPMIGPRRLKEWLDILHGVRQKQEYEASKFYFGSAGSLPAVERRLLLNPRQASFAAVQLAEADQTPKILPVLITVLREDSDPAIRAQAAKTLASLAAKSGKDLKNFQESVTVLLGLVRDEKDAKVRVAVVDALAYMVEAPNLAADGVPVLTAAFKDGDAELRRTIANTLYAIGKPAAPALPEIAKWLADDKVDIVDRQLAARLIGRIGPPEALAQLPQLRDLLSNNKTPAPLRLAAAEALGQMVEATNSAVAPLAAVLGDAEASVELRKAAATGLVQFGTGVRSAQATLLKSAAGDSDATIRGLVMNLLAKLAADASAEDRVRIARVLLGRLDDNALENRILGAELLGVVGPGGLDKPLIADVRTGLDRLAHAPQKDAQKAAENALAHFPAP